MRTREMAALLTAVLVVGLGSAAAFGDVKAAEGPAGLATASSAVSAVVEVHQFDENGLARAADGTVWTWDTGYGTIAGDHSSQRLYKPVRIHNGSSWEVSHPTFTTVRAIDAQTYTGSAVKPSPVVEAGAKTLVKGRDYTVSYSDNVAVGTAKVTVTGKGAYTGTSIATFKIKRATNPMKAKAKTVKLKASKLAKKKVTIKKSKAFKVKKAKGKVTFKKKSGSKRIKVGKGGKLVVKKGTKKGTYKVKVKVKAAGDKNYKAKTQQVTVKVKVKA